jgi:hypothetical protein
MSNCCKIYKSTECAGICSTPCNIFQAERGYCFSIYCFSWLGLGTLMIVLQLTVHVPLIITVMSYNTKVVACYPPYVLQNKIVVPSLVKWFHEESNEDTYLAKQYCHFYINLIKSKTVWFGTTIELHSFQNGGSSENRLNINNVRVYMVVWILCIVDCHVYLWVALPPKSCIFYINAHGLNATHPSNYTPILFSFNINSHSSFLN